MREVRHKYDAKTRDSKQTALPELPEILEPLDLSKMTEAELSDELEKGLEDIHQFHFTTRAHVETKPYRERGSKLPCQTQQTKRRRTLMSEPADSKCDRRINRTPRPHMNQHFHQHGQTVVFIHCTGDSES